jgi:hypothetical protein
MRHIYQNSKHVFVWLGATRDEQSTGIDNAFEMVKIVGVCAREFTQIRNINLRDLSIYMLRAARDIKRPAAFTDDSWKLTSEFQALAEQRLGQWGNLDTIVDCLHALSSAPWWSRVWVIQEYVNAPSVTFHFRELEVCDDFLALTYALATQMQFRLGNFRMGVNMLGYTRLKQVEILGLRRRVETSPWRLSDVTSMLFATEKGPQATDLRDRVYGLLGVVGDATDIIPDYTIGERGVFITASQSMLSTGYTGTLFAPVTSHTSNLELPSWAYDWSPNIELGFWTDFSACHKTKMEAHFSNDSTVILRGARFGTISITDVKTWKSIYSVSIEDLEKEKAYIRKKFQKEDHPLLNIWPSWKRWIQHAMEFLEHHEKPTDVSPMLAKILTLEGRGPNRLLPEYPKTYEKARRISTLQEALDLDQWESEVDYLVIWGRAMTFLGEMQLVALNSGDLGFCREGCKARDEVIVFDGVQSPLVVRSTGRDNYRIIGPAYICGVMGGEFMMTHPAKEMFKIV